MNFTCNGFFRIGLLVGVAFLASSWVAAAQTYPTKSIRIIVPFPAGGATDTYARGVGNILTKSLGQPVVIDNRGGGNGLIGFEAGRTRGC